MNVLLNSFLLVTITGTLHADILHGTIEVTQNAVNSAPSTMELTSGSSSNVTIETPFNRGDYGLVFPLDTGETTSTEFGVLLTSPAEHSSTNGGEALFQATTSADITPSNTYSIALHKTPDGSESNLNAAFAWFPFSDWYGAHTTGPNNGETDSLNSHNDIILGAHFIDEVSTAGIFTVDLTSIDSELSSANGIVLANGGENENNFAISEANSDGSFTIYNHDNGTDGQVYEQERISFVYLHQNDIGRDGLLALGRVNSNATLDVSAGNFTVNKGSTGEWLLSIPGHSPATGTLLVTPASEANNTFGRDNFVTSEWDAVNNRWSIKSWDLKGGSTPAVAQDSSSGNEDLFNFAFINSTVVTNNNDSGSGSLRQTINNAQSGASITFDTSLSGETITLAGNQLEIPKDLIIDASNLPKGITIDGGQQSRVLEVSSGATVTLDSLTLTKGNTTASGGGVLNNGTLTVQNCTFFENTANLGGGLSNIDPSTCNIDSCTFSLNSATSRGGAIYAQGTLLLDNTTVSDNHAANLGGGLFLQSILLLPSDDGTASITLENSIIAGNTAPSHSDITTEISPSITLQGTNLIGDNSGTGFAAVPGLIGTSADPVQPRLAPLSHYGGPTMTMHPCANSPTILTGATTTRTDQRGFTLTGPPTIGALKIPTPTIVGGEFSLRNELASAPSSPGKVIHLGSFLDGEIMTLTGGQLLIPSHCNGLFIDASALPNGCIIDANGLFTNHRILEIQPNSTVALHSLNLTGGWSDEEGGGIYANGSGTGNQLTLTLSNCTLFKNFGWEGGAIHNSGINSGKASLFIHNSTLSENFALSKGGGIHHDGSGTDSSASLTLHSTTISENSGSIGGGLHTTNLFGGHTDLTIKNSIIASNTHIENGGPNDFREFDGLGGTTIVSIIGNNLFSNLSGQTSLSTSTPGLIVADPQLSPLAHFGGSTRTMHPLVNSPAILAGSDTTRTDQRGFALTGPPTIGAVKATNPIEVSNETTLRNELTNAANTKGKIISFAPSLDGQTLTLTSGQLLIPSLCNGLFLDASSLTNGLTIDANGQTTNHRVLEIQPNSTVALQNLHLTGGNVSGSFPNGVGGGIFASGSGADDFIQLSVLASSLSNNSAVDGGGTYCDAGLGAGSFIVKKSQLTGNSASDSGGGIYSVGRGSFDDGTGQANLFVDQTTLSGNSAASAGGGLISATDFQGEAALFLCRSTVSGNTAQTAGGGIYQINEVGRNFATIFNSTISGNSAQTSGGGISQYSIEGTTPLSIYHCTFTENSAAVSGGGVFSDADGGNATLTLKRSIIANNTAPSGPDLWQFPGPGGFTSASALSENLLSSLNGQTSLTPSTPGLIVANPLLSPLDDFGGPTQTHLPLPGSSALDAVSNTFPATDQRGILRLNNGDGSGSFNPDIGAAEAPDWTDPTGTELAWIFTTDSDGDGNSYGLEFALGTDPSTPDPAHPDNLTAPTFTSGEAALTFGRNMDADPYITWILKRSTTLQPGSFNEIYRFVGDTMMETLQTDIDSTVTSDSFSITDQNPPANRAFYRIEAMYNP